MECHVEVVEEDLVAEAVEGVAGAVVSEGAGVGDNLSKNNKLQKFRN